MHAELIKAQHDLQEQINTLEHLSNIGLSIGYDTPITQSFLLKQFNLEPSVESVGGLVYKTLTFVGQIISGIFKAIFGIIKKIVSWSKQKKLERGVLVRTIRANGKKVNKNLAKSSGEVMAAPDSNKLISTLEQITPVLLDSKEYLNSQPSTGIISALDQVDIKLSRDWSIETPKKGIINVLEINKPIKSAVAIGWTDHTIIADHLERAESLFVDINKVLKSQEKFEKYSSSKMNDLLNELNKTKHDGELLDEAKTLQKYVTSISRMVSLYSSVGINTYKHIESFAQNLVR